MCRGMLFVWMLFVDCLVSSICVLSDSWRQALVLLLLHYYCLNLMMNSWFDLNVGME